jgi:hypothetical protein
VTDSTAANESAPQDATVATPSVTQQQAQAGGGPPLPDIEPATTPASESTRWRYGLYATIAAVSAILIAFVFASLRYNTAQDVSTALAAITGTLGTILGAYLGVQTGSQGKEQAEAARQKAETRAVAFAAAAPWPAAADALRSMNAMERR